MDSLGYIAHQASQYTRAIEHCQQSRTLSRDLGDTCHEQRPIGLRQKTR